MNHSRTSYGHFKVDPDFYAKPVPVQPVLTMREAGRALVIGILGGCAVIVLGIIFV